VLLCFEFAAKNALHNYNCSSHQQTRKFIPFKDHSFHPLEARTSVAAPKHTRSDISSAAQAQCEERASYTARVVCTAAVCQQRKRADVFLTCTSAKKCRHVIAQAEIFSAAHSGSSSNMLHNANGRRRCMHTLSVASSTTTATMPQLPLLL
jgi:hypothetical protein